MNVPPSLAPLVDDGIIEEVVRPLMSGKEAQVFLVIAGGKERVAKVYKDAQHRSFKHRADYTEGRRTRNTRDQRAVARRTKHGRSQDEAAWRSTEVDMIYRLRAAGVRVPEPYIFSDGVLVMEFITDADGLAAPRLGDAKVSPSEAQAIFEALMQEVVRMLCAGVVHGDLSDFNVLLGEHGPVVIDFPQALDAASNRNARSILIRDVDNLHNFLARATRGYRPKPFAQEMWALFERGELLPDTKLKGLYRPDTRAADVSGVLRELDFAKRDAVRAGRAEGERARTGGPERDERGESVTGATTPRRRMEVVVSRGPVAPRAPETGSRPRQPAAPRRKPSGPDAATLRAVESAQPVLSEAQRAKAAQIAEAARQAQAKRAERAKQPETRSAAGRSQGARPNAPRGEAARHGGQPSSAGDPAGSARATPPPRDARKHTTTPPLRSESATAGSGTGEAKRRRRRRRGRSGGSASGPAS